MTLAEFITSNPDPREMKRAIAVNMRLQGLKHKEIQATLGVCSSFISRWERSYREQGVSGLRLGHKGSSGYLDKYQRQAIIAWIQQASQRNLEDLIDHIEQTYGVAYRSLQSYYELLHEAGMSWHKGRKKVPDMTQAWWCSTTK